MYHFLIIVLQLPTACTLAVIACSHVSSQPPGSVEHWWLETGHGNMKVRKWHTSGLGLLFFVDSLDLRNDEKTLLMQIKLKIVLCL